MKQSLISDIILLDAALDIALLQSLSLGYLKDLAYNLTERQKALILKGIAKYRS